jgi:cysteine desulfurase
MRAWFHTDAVQAVGKIAGRFSSPQRAGVNALTLSAHKMGGPKGAARWSRQARGA